MKINTNISIIIANICAINTNFGAIDVNNVIINATGVNDANISIIIANYSINK